MSTPVQSPAAYTPRAEVRETRSTRTKPPSSSSDAGLLEPEVGGVGHRAEREDAVRALDGAAVGEGDGHGVAVAGDRLHPGLREHLHAAALGDVLEHGGGVGVLAGQHPVARGDQRDLDAEREVGAGELGAGDARADDDQLRRRLVEVVDLLPGQDPLAVRLGGRQRARRRTGRDQHRVGLEHLLAAVGQARPRRGRGRRGGRGRATTVTPSFSRRRPMSADWSAASCLTRSLTRAQVDAQRGRGVALVVGEADAELGGPRDVGHQLRGGDQGLAGHAVGDHRRAAEPVGVDDGDLARRAGRRRARTRSRPARRR